MTQAENDGAIIGALRASHYPSATDESLYAVLAYCRAIQVDPMLRAVHIVPMKTNDPVSGREVWRDVIMPGIGLYRIIAARSGVYAGKSEPTFGPLKTYRVGRVEIEAPESCALTVRRIVAGHIVEFTARELFVENVATKSDGSPNAMWTRRKFGQLAKCAEAQALRQAFPDWIPSGPTADERIIDDDDAPTVRALEAPRTDPQGDALAAQLRRRPEPEKSEPVYVGIKAAETVIHGSTETVSAQIAAIREPRDADECLRVLRALDIDPRERRELIAKVHQTMRHLIRGAQTTEE